MMLSQSGMKTKGYFMDKKTHNINILIQENAFEYVVCKMAAIFFSTPVT